MESQTDNPESWHDLADLGSLQQELSCLSQHTEWNRWEIKELEGRVLDAVERVDATRREYEELENDIEILQGEVDAVRNRIDRHEDLLEDQVRMMQLIARDLANVRSELSEMRRVQQCSIFGKIGCKVKQLF